MSLYRLILDNKALLKSKYNKIISLNNSKNTSKNTKKAIRLHGCAQNKIIMTCIRLSFYVTAVTDALGNHSVKDRFFRLPQRFETGAFTVRAVSTN